MQTKNIKFDPLGRGLTIIENIYYENHRGKTNHRERAQMLKILKRVIDNELTDQQRRCVILYYFRHMKMRDIASELGVSPSTVSRHIKAALRKMKKIGDYYA